MRADSLEHGLEAPPLSHLSLKRRIVPPIYTACAFLALYGQKSEKKPNQSETHSHRKCQEQDTPPD